MPRETFTPAAKEILSMAVSNAGFHYLGNGKGLRRGKSGFTTKRRGNDPQGLIRS
jgi:hypothetical protein